MCNPNFQSLFATMSGETAISAEAKTCVFWDVDDCPIPEDLHHNSICWNIKSALANEGCGGNVEFKVYGRDEKLADGYLMDAGTTFVPKVAIHVREMLFHICEWAMVNPRGSNLLLISKITLEEEMFVIPEVNKLVTSVEFLAERGYNVLLAPPELPDKLVLHFTPRSVWNWTILSHGGVPSAYPLELQPQLFKPNFHNLLETDSLAKTWVFWEWPTLGVELYEIIPNIESALVSRGFPGNTSFNYFFDNLSRMMM